jgi:capsular exopolysaccharide synthesis family protein
MSRTYEVIKKIDQERDSRRQRLQPAGRLTPATAAEANDRQQIHYERLRVWMSNQASNGSAVRSVMVTACRSGSGTTTTVAGLAAALSDQPAARVLVVDANFRTPRLDRVYGTDSSGGFSELLTDPAAEGNPPVQVTRRTNLFLLGTGTRSGSPVGIFQRSAIERLMAGLRARFDFVVFDSAPILEFPEGCALAPHVDAVLLVIDAQKTSLGDARRAMRELERVDARAAGLVLNRERDYVPRVIRRFMGAAE